MTPGVGLRRRVRRWIGRRFGNEWLLSAWPLHSVLGYSVRGSLVRERLHGVDLEYDIRSIIGVSLFSRGVFERHEIAFIEQLVRRLPPRSVVLDVGANIGLHSIAAARSRSDVRIYAFEPSPSTLRLLERNLRRNRLDAKVEVVPEAVSSSAGSAVLHECDDNAFSSLKDTRRAEVLATTDVRTTTLDGFVESRRLTQIGLIKIDVEGFEDQVVVGGLETLRRTKCDLLVEIYGGEQSNPDPTGTIERIQALGYDAYTLVKGIPVPYRDHDDRQYNYYFTASRAAVGAS